MEVINILPKFAQWETIPYAADFACQECGKSAIQGKDEYGNQTKEKPNLVGWCETNNGFMAVFECPCCHSKFRFHPQMKHFDLDQLDFYLGAYYIGDGDSIWIANAKELSEMLDKKRSKVMKKFLITIAPLCVVLFILMLITWGLKGVLAFFGAVLYAVALAFCFTKWADFVDKHIKD